MPRIRSPGYPSFTLEQVIDFASKVHLQDRQHPVDRETAARHMGFSGLSGTSDRALSAAMHFGLMEKVQKGELRVTHLALRIIHPDSPIEKRAALHEAGFRPDLFKELRERYPGEPPSKDSLSSYLLRSGFASAAIPTATRAYLETCYFLQRLGAYDSDGQELINDPDSALDLIPEPVMTTFSTQERQFARSDAVDPHQPMRTGVTLGLKDSTVRAVPSTRTLTPNEVYLDFRGSREVHVEGILDLNGILDLEEKLKAVKMLLKPPVASAHDADAPSEGRPLDLDELVGRGSH